MCKRAVQYRQIPSRLALCGFVFLFGVQGTTYASKENRGKVRSEKQLLRQRHQLGAKLLAVEDRLDNISEQSAPSSMADAQKRVQKRLELESKRSRLNEKLSTNARKIDRVRTKKFVLSRRVHFELGQLVGALEVDAKTKEGQARTFREDTVPPLETVIERARDWEKAQPVRDWLAGYLDYMVNRRFDQERDGQISTGWTAITYGNDAKRFALIHTDGHLIADGPLREQIQSTLQVLQAAAKRVERKHEPISQQFRVHRFDGTDGNKLEPVAGDVLRAQGRALREVSDALWQVFKARDRAPEETVSAASNEG